jgi:DNA-binding transcriptional regulator YhcF (GntR family)
MGGDFHRKKRRRSNRKFVQIFCDVIESPAYRSLSVYAVAALVQVCHRFNGANNGKISFSVREMAESLSTGPRQASSAFKELRERGFLVATTKGWFSTKHRHATEWRLTFQHCNHQPPTKDYEKWQPEIQNTVSPEESAGVPGGHTTGSRMGARGVPTGHTPSPTTVSSEVTHIESTIPLATLQERTERSFSTEAQAAISAPLVPSPEHAVSASHLRTSAGKVVELVGRRKQHLASHVARLTGTHTAGVAGLLIAFHPRARAGDAAYVGGGGDGGDMAVPDPSLGIEGWCR